MAQTVYVPDQNKYVDFPDDMDELSVSYYIKRDVLNEDPSYYGMLAGHYWDKTKEKAAELFNVAPEDIEQQASQQLETDLSAINTSNITKPQEVRPTNWTPEEETGFKGWYKGWSEGLRLNPNPDDERQLYDYRSAFRSGATPDGTGHWPSEFKFTQETHGIDHPNRWVPDPNNESMRIDTTTGQSYKRPAKLKAMAEGFYYGIGDWARDLLESVKAFELRKESPKADFQVDFVQRNRDLVTSPEFANADAAGKERLLGKLRKQQQTESLARGDSVIEKMDRENFDAYMKDYHPKVLKALDTLASAYPEAPEDAPYWEQLARAGGRSFPNLPLQAGATMLRVGLAVLPVMYAQMFGASYQDAKKLGADNARAFETAAVNAAAQTALEYSGTLVEVGLIKNLAKAFGNKKLQGEAGSRLGLFIKTLAKEGATEGFEEFVQTFPDIVAQYYAANPQVTVVEAVQSLKKNWKQALAEAGEQGLAGAMLGVAFGGLFTGPTMLQETIANRLQNRRVKKIEDNLKRIIAEEQAEIKAKEEAAAGKEAPKETAAPQVEKPAAEEPETEQQKIQRVMEMQGLLSTAEEPQVEVAKPAAIPELKNMTEAIDYGMASTPEHALTMQEERKRLLAEANTLMNKGEAPAAAKLLQKSNLLRLAIAAAEDPEAFTKPLAEPSDIEDIQVAATEKGGKFDMNGKEERDWLKSLGYTDVQIDQAAKIPEKQTSELMKKPVGKVYDPNNSWDREMLKSIGYTDAQIDQAGKVTLTELEKMYGKRKGRKGPDMHGMEQAEVAEVPGKIDYGGFWEEAGHQWTPRYGKHAGSTMSARTMKERGYPVPEPPNEVIKEDYNTADRWAAPDMNMVIRRPRTQQSLTAPPVIVAVSPKAYDGETAQEILPDWLKSAAKNFPNADILIVRKPSDAKTFLRGKQVFTITPTEPGAKKALKASLKKHKNVIEATTVEDLAAQAGQKFVKGEETKALEYPEGLEPKVEEEVIEGPAQTGVTRELLTERAVALNKRGIAVGAGKHKGAYLVSTGANTGTIYGPLPASLRKKVKTETKEKVTPVLGKRETVTKHTIEIDGVEYRWIDAPLLPQAHKPRIAKIKELAYKFKDAFGWYKEEADFVKNFTKVGISQEETNKYIKILAILSQGKSPYAAQTDFGKVKESIEKNGKVLGGPNMGLTQALADKINTVWEGKDTAKTLEEFMDAYGAKIGSMVFVMLNPMDFKAGAVVVDRHMGRPWGYNFIYHPEGKSSFRVPDKVRREIRDDVVQAAEEMSKELGYDLPPNAVQAALWYAAGAGRKGGATRFSEAIQMEPKKSLGMKIFELITAERQQIVSWQSEQRMEIRGAERARPLTSKESRRLDELESRYKEPSFFNPMTVVEHTELLRLRHITEGDTPHAWSRNDVKKRMEAHTEANNYVPLGYWYVGGSRKESFAQGKVPHLTTVYESEIYDAERDPSQYWAAARKRASQDPEVVANRLTSDQVLVNAFANMLKETTDFKGFLYSQGNNKVVVTFEAYPVEQLNEKVHVYSSDVVGSAMKMPKTLKGASQVTQIMISDFRNFLQTAFTTQAVEVSSYTPTIAKFDGENLTGGDYDYGLDVDIRGPIDAIRAAVSVIGASKKQNAVMLLRESENPTGLLKEFRFKYTDLGLIEKVLKKNGFDNFAVSFRADGIWFSTYFDYATSSKVSAQLDKLLADHGVDSTATSHDVAMELVLKDQYEGNITKHYGKKAGGTVYERASLDGDKWAAEANIRSGIVGAKVGLPSQETGEGVGEGKDTRKPKGEEPLSDAEATAVAASAKRINMAKSAQGIVNEEQYNKLVKIIDEVLGTLPKEVADKIVVRLPKKIAKEVISAESRRQHAELRGKNVDEADTIIEGSSGEDTKNLAYLIRLSLEPYQVLFGGVNFHEFAERLNRTAFHESYHVAERWLLTEDALQKMQEYMPNTEERAKRYGIWAMNEKRFLENYSNTPQFILRGWLTMKHFLYRLGSALQGTGWFTVNDVFRNVFYTKYVPHYGVKGSTEAFFPSTPLSEKHDTWYVDLNTLKLDNVKPDHDSYMEMGKKAEAVKRLEQLQKIFYSGDPFFYDFTTADFATARPKHYNYVAVYNHADAVEVIRDARNRATSFGEMDFNTDGEQAAESDIDSKDTAQYRADALNKEPALLEEDYLAPDNISMIEMPEMIQLILELNGGKYPRVFDKVKGPFGEGAKIRLGDLTIDLNTELFKGKDQYRARAALARMIGHIVDYIPEQRLGGTVLGKIAQMKRVVNQYLAPKPGMPGELTAMDKLRLYDEAKKFLEAGKNVTKLIDEEIEKEIGITPEDVTNIWNQVEAAKTMSPELYRYVAGLGSAAKKNIVKEALKGMVAAELKRFVHTIKVKTGQKIMVTEIKPYSQDELIKLATQYIEQEIQKRQLFKNADLKAELYNLSKRWRPFPGNSWELKPEYVAFRQSNDQLYADAISVLLNNPALLKRTAPKFYVAFFNWIGNNPQFRDAYNSVQSAIRSGTVEKVRVERTYSNFDKGNEAYYQDLEAGKQSTWGKFSTAFIDVYHYVLHDLGMLNEDKMAAHKNPRFALEDFSYSVSEGEAYMTKVKQYVRKLLDDNNLMWDREFGLYAKLRRIVGERYDIANPEGWDPRTAHKELRDLEARLSKEQFAAIRQAMDNLRKIRTEMFIKKARAADVFSDELMKKIEDNEYYVTFDVIDYIEKRHGKAVGKFIKEQIGTFKPVANPVTATIMKDVQMIKMVNYNKAVRSVVKMYLEHADIFNHKLVPAEERWNDKTHRREPVDPQDPKMRLVTYMYKGRMHGYYLPTEIADSLAFDPYTHSLTGDITRMAASPLRKVFTEYNPVFWMANVIKDLVRGWKILPGTVNPLSWVNDWRNAIKPSFRSAYGIPDPVVQEMQKGNMLISMVDYRGMNPEESQIERMLKAFSLAGPKEFNRQIMTPFQHFVDYIHRGAAFMNYYYGNVGKGLERTTKVAAYTRLKRMFPDMPTQALAHIVRNAGSPDFLRRGRDHLLWNNLLLYSNAIKEGFRGDVDAFQRNPASYVAKLVTLVMLPQMLQLLALAGYMGGDMRELFEAIPERDLVNSWTLPIGLTNTGKAVYIAIPKDDISRFVSGILWTLLKSKEVGIGETLGKLVTHTAEMTPSETPTFGLVQKLLQYANGQNPYDSFYGRNVIDDTTFQAGGWRSHKEMAKYFWNQTVGSAVYRFRGEDPQKIKEELESVLGFPIHSDVPEWAAKTKGIPIIGNMVGRFLKVTDSGIREHLKRDLKIVQSVEATAILEARDAARKLIDDTPLGVDDLLALARKPDALEKNVLRMLSRKYNNVYLDTYLTAKSRAEKWTVLSHWLKSQGKIVSPEVEEAIKKSLSPERISREDILQMLPPERRSEVMPVDKPPLLTQAGQALSSVFSPSEAHAEETRFEKGRAWQGKYDKPEYYRTTVEQVKILHPEVADIPTEIVLAMIETESQFRPNIKSAAGAQGLMQVKPSTFKEQYQRAAKPIEKIKDPSANILGGMLYLRELKAKYKTWEKALEAYNVGPTGLARGERNLNYVYKVMSRKGKYEEE